ncbi:hypothetical protein V8C35DRAFT_165853 [Trichoderma chlorosporum]
MDPITALGLASNVVQFVDFASKVILSTRAIYTSASGLSKDGDIFGVISNTLTRLSSAIVTSEGCPEDLLPLCLKAKEVAQDLLAVLEALKPKGERTKLKSFLAAVKEVCGRDKCNALVVKLSMLQSQITLLLQTRISNVVMEIADMIKTREATDARLELKRARELEKLQSDVVGAVKSLSKEHRATEGFERVSDILADLHIDDEDQLATTLRHLSTALPKFRKHVQGFSKNLHEMKADDALLEQLWFENLTSREDAVPQAHANTFEWIFKDFLPDTSTSIGLVNWLRTENGVFWIQGKPGSGKSTLVKFLAHHPQTLSHLQQWSHSESKQLVLAKFYFWNSGSALQKSQEGLLRSLLFEILRQCPELISTVRGDRRQFSSGSPAKGLPSASGSKLLQSSDVDRDWTVAELKWIMEKIAERETSKKFCFIIDGLDEFKVGDTQSHADLLDTIKCLGSSPNIKLCVSSRPWTIFRDAFGEKASQVMKLEDLTKGDIRRYVQDKFNTHDQYLKLNQSDPQYNHLIEEVVNKAQGVFLWVFLVVRDLLEGLTYNDTIKTMHRRLDVFPETLEAFFEQMLNTIPKFYRLQTSRVFQMATSVDYPLLLVTYSFLDNLEDDPSLVDTEIRRTCDKREVIQRQDTIRRRLDAWSKGLLEVTGVAGSEPFLNYKVDFLHRTVRDFLQSEEIQGITNQSSQSRCSTWLQLCDTITLQFKRAPETTFQPSVASSSRMEKNSDDSTRKALNEICHFAHNALRDGADASRVHEALRKAIHAASSVESLASMNVREEMLGAACQNGLKDYVQLELSTDYAAWQPPQLANVLRLAVTPGGITGQIYPEIVAQIVRSAADLGYDPRACFSSVFNELTAKIGISPDHVLSPKQESVINLVKFILTNGDWLPGSFLDRHFPQHRTWVHTQTPAHEERKRSADTETGNERKRSRLDWPLEPSY